MKRLYFLIAMIYTISIEAQNDYDFFPGGSICEIEEVQYALVFEDNFNGNALDETYWTRYYPYGENGSDQCPFCRTHSTDDNQEGQIYRDENVRVQNGSLFLDVKKENANWYQFDKNYTSGMIHSKQTFNDYSKFEVRCKIPNGTGYWPAFWMFGWSTEIDVFELYEDSDEYESSVHFWNGSTSERWTRIINTGIDLSQDFHTYAVEYDRYRIKFLFDGAVVGIMPRLIATNGVEITGCSYIPQGLYVDYHIFPQYGNPLNVIANVALLNQQAENEMVDESSMEIDYIKVYQRIDPCENFEDFVRVEENDTWTADRRIRVLRIEEDVTLNLSNCTIEFQENGRIYLDEGAKLIMNGATLTSCSPDIKWDGIKADDNAYINMSSWSRIENANIGAKLGSTPLGSPTGQIVFDDTPTDRSWTY